MKDTPSGTLGDCELIRPYPTVRPSEQSMPHRFSGGLEVAADQNQPNGPEKP